MNPGTIKRRIKQNMTATKRKRSTLIREMDKALSSFVRQFYANGEGIVKCYTCNYSNHWKKMQNGHYITRSAKYTRWELDNCRPQCFVCNMRNQGMSHLFRENLVKEIGLERVEGLEAKAKLLFREQDSWLETQFTAIQALLANLSR